MKNCNEGGEFHLTIIRDTSLSRRLASEISFAFVQMKRAWPSLRSDPIGFLFQQSVDGLHSIKRFCAHPHALPASLTSLVAVFSVVLSVFLLSSHLSKPAESIESQELSQPVRIDLPITSDTRSASGVGANGQGRVGVNQNKGEGSLSTPARSGGGGGGGLHSQIPAQQGRPPQPSDIPAPIPNARLPFPPTLPAAGLDIDPALWRNLPYPSYGDPRSKSIVPSNGSGDGGGMGPGNGTGIGEGDGSGFGPGRDGNIGGGPKKIGSGGKGAGSGNDPNDLDRVFSPPQVTERAHLLSKPEPQYTEEARRNQITGTVILRAVFSKSGEVTGIHAVQSLPSGLTEKAITAARQIRFVPAKKSGQPVSVYMQLEYNFNLY